MGTTSSNQPPEDVTNKSANRPREQNSLWSEISEFQIRKGTVTHVTREYALVDLGGIEGMLHIMDMPWVSHGPARIAEYMEVAQIIDVIILYIDREEEKIALGLKQTRPSPWDNVEEKYPVGMQVRGEVVNVMSYGAFVKLEPGIEGLVPIGEMSSTKHINHPSDFVTPGDEVDVVVLSIDKDKQDIMLSMKQAQPPT